MKNTQNKYNSVSFPKSFKSIMDSLDTDMGIHLKEEDKLKKMRMNIKSSRTLSTGNPNPTSAHDEEADTPEEVNVFYLKCKIAIIKSVIFAGYTVFASLLGTGGMALTIPNIGANIIANPMGVLIGMGIVFMASFFTSMIRQLKLEEEQILPKK